MNQTELLCPYCLVPTERRNGSAVYQFRPDLAHCKFFVCPSCSARVGCHALTGKPLGTPANAELRALRRRCHDLFDPLWNRGARHLRPIARAGAYAWLAEKLGVDRVHFGEADVELARRAAGFLAFLDPKPRVDELIAWADGRWEWDDADMDTWGWDTP